MRHRRPKRLPNFNYCGKHRYFVTCCVAKRRHAFTGADAVDAVRQQVLRTCLDRGFEEIASVYMPDHLHALFRGTGQGAAFRPFMTLLRQRTAVIYRAFTGDRLWQEGYYDRVLRANDDTCAWVEYIVQNPVRANLVARPEEYPFTYRSPDS